jgi:antitoxin VapB
MEAAMAFHVRDPETDRLVRELAQQKGTGLTEAIKLAVAAELKRAGQQVPLRERLRAITDPIARLPDHGPPLDKAFFDDLSGM